MLATLVIGLREGLEASLIVGIIAAFLKRTGKPLRPMWIGVGIAVLLSLAVGIALQLVSASLPQAQQEGMETIIGLVAVAAVTGMIGWMNVHARNMRAEIEQHAALALRDGTAWALVGMAFLAVLKEGFETSVFLLASFQSSTSFVGAGAGAVLGIALAVAIGVGIFRGGVRLNLSRFFRITGVFLVLVAAGLVLRSLRTAHEAGWIQIGQQSTITIDWLAPNGSVQAALLTGLLGIPSDPRVIEVLGWLAYLIPTMLFLLWPVKSRPRGAALARMRLLIAAALVIVAAVLAAAVSLPSYAPPATASLRNPHSAVLVRAPADLTGAKRVTHEGIVSDLAVTRTSSTADGKPQTLTLDQLVALNGGRLPIGIGPAQNPGPFTANWVTSTATSVWVYRGGILDATRTARTILTLTGGGLSQTRTLVPESAQSASLRLPSAERAAIVQRIDRDRTASAELMLWKLWIPLVLAIAALVLLFSVLRARVRESTRLRQANVRENFA